MSKRDSKNTIWLLAASMLLAACGDKATEQISAETAADKKPVRSMIVSATQPTVSELEITEHSVGALESIFIPEVSAEVEGRVIAGHIKAGQRVEQGQLLVELDTEDYSIAERGAKAEVAQLTALFTNQKRTVERYGKLVEAKLISTDRYDDAKAQLEALEEQLKAAQERLKQRQRGLTKTRVISPYSGVVDAELASIGDFVKVGDPLLRITKIDVLRARLPLPETLAPKIVKGLTVRLVSPLDPDTIVETEIMEIRPIVGTSNRAIDVLSLVENPGKWQPGASVTGTIVLETRAKAITVPLASVVLRPAGKVVYVIEDGTARQRIVKTGVYKSGMVEIIEGLTGSETIVTNGSGFLTEGTPVTVKDSVGA
ncbi:MAG TPA: efflux RND transporter periplasmic adaptor subunit [Porticoccaceae bacterium]|nr:efflux RND transporter periplasmic adaptor subunit [Porticoccaceae bacterium]HCO61448.1 efflux RND transporter periplasmic adaptor subunit [Porticoccaceae bacterium]